MIMMVQSEEKRLRIVREEEKEQNTSRQIKNTRKNSLEKRLKGTRKNLWVTEKTKVEKVVE